LILISRGSLGGGEGDLDAEYDLFLAGADPADTDEDARRLRLTGDLERLGLREAFLRLSPLPFLRFRALPPDRLDEPDDEDEEPLSESESESESELLESESESESLELSESEEDEPLEEPERPFFFLRSFSLSARILFASPAVGARASLPVTGTPEPPNSAGVATLGLSPPFFGLRSCCVLEGLDLYTGPAFLQS